MTKNREQNRIRLYCMRSVGWREIPFENEWRSLHPGVCQNQFFHIQLDQEFLYPKASEINHVVMLKFKDGLNVMPWIFHLVLQSRRLRFYTYPLF